VSGDGHERFLLHLRPGRPDHRVSGELQYLAQIGVEEVHVTLSRPILPCLLSRRVRTRKITKDI
jgi:hypothetical protein